MTVQVVKWEDGQGIRIPESFLAEAGITLGDSLVMTLNRGIIMIEKLPGHRTLEERAAAYDGKLGPYEETIDWGGPAGREIW